MTIALPWPGRRPARSDAEEDPRPASTGEGSVADARFGGGDDEPTPWVRVYTAATIEEAHVIKGALEAADLPTALRYESLGMMVGAALTVRGVDVLVPRPLEDRARAVLDQGGPSEGHGPARRRRGRRADGS